MPSENLVKSKPKTHEKGNTTTQQRELISNQETEIVKIKKEAEQKSIPAREPDLREMFYALCKQEKQKRERLPEVPVPQFKRRGSPSVSESKE